MAITVVNSRDELSDLVEELGVHFEGDEVDDLEDKDVCLNKGEKNFQEVYDCCLKIVTNMPRLLRTQSRK